MSQETCEGECANCPEENCVGREIPKLSPHAGTSIKKIIAVVSGKGGVGKSFVTSLLAKELKAKGHKVAILDADATGPSIPKAFGIAAKAEGDDNGIYPCYSKGGIGVMSVNCLLEDETEPLIWRGPMVSNLIGQLFTDVLYGDLDYLLIDMPPGTGDVPLTVFQQIPIDAAIIVTSPQDLVGLIVRKSVKMCQEMPHPIPILGAVTNMAYAKCPHCGEKVYVYGKSHPIEGVKALDEVMIDPKLAEAVDDGEVESVDHEVLPIAVRAVESLLG